MSPCLPAPVFEGSEKRLEVHFHAGINPTLGLRALSRSQLDALLFEAACCIVSQSSNACCDAYVLSESSLFVFPTKLVLKTCGTTKPLDSLPVLLRLAASLGMVPRRCKYSRASFLFPDKQLPLYQSFADETALLGATLGELGQRGEAYVLGDACAGLQWHTYVADDASKGGPAEASLEVCMTDICPIKAAQFTQGEGYTSAAQTTLTSGIQALLPGAAIDAFMFEPCGYSMNGLEASTYSTIHITPEADFSYASIELSGCALDAGCLTTIVSKVAEAFRPSRLMIALSAAGYLDTCIDVTSHVRGYSVKGSFTERFSCPGSVTFTSLATSAITDPAAPTALLKTPVPHLSLPSGHDSDGDSQTMWSGSCSPITKCSPWEEVDGGVPAALLDINVTRLASGHSEEMEAHMAALIATERLEDPLYVIDLGMVTALYKAWAAALPRVTPFYAVKCFGDRAMLATLASLGAGFDCASQAEMEAVLDLGVQPERIVLANCCKRPRDIRTACARGVALTTFDTVAELEKVAALHPGARLLLRLRADDPGARCQLGNKYGANPASARDLLEASQRLGLTAVGVSFHVGSGATNPDVFREAIALSREVFDVGASLGLSMDLLDIGGGFCGGDFDAQGRVDLGEVPAAVNGALERHFPPGCGVRIIAEPGRYFAEASATLACMVIGQRDTKGEDGAPGRDYWITDGLYGSMNSLLYDHAVLSAHPLRTAGPAEVEAGVLVKSTVFGPTCDGLDVVLRDAPLPELAVGDWLVFPKMGAYTLAGACDFNGMGGADVRYVFSRRRC